MNIFNMQHISYDQLMPDLRVAEPVSFSPALSALSTHNVSLIFHL